MFLSKAHWFLGVKHAHDISFQVLIFIRFSIFVCQKLVEKTKIHVHYRVIGGQIQPDLVLKQLLPFLLALLFLIHYSIVKQSCFRTTCEQDKCTKSDSISFIHFDKSNINFYKSWHLVYLISMGGCIIKRAKTMKKYRVKILDL